MKLLSIENAVNKYHIDENGSIWYYTKTGRLKQVSAGIGTGGYLKVNLTVYKGDNRIATSTTYLVVNLMKMAFFSDSDLELEYLDYNKSNCKLNNLVPVNHLIEFYKNNGGCDNV